MRFMSQYESLADLENKITTFDGVEHDFDEIIERMHDDEFYYGYLGKQALSSSSLKAILHSPKKYLQMLEGQDSESQALRDGKLFHWSLLEPDVFENVKVVESSTRTTKVFKEALAEFGEAYIPKEIEKAIVLSEVIRKNEEANSYLQDAEFEVPMIKMVHGVPFRAKADIIKGDLIVDLKTTSDLKKFKWSAYNFSYDLQAYLYLQMFPQAKSFGFLCIDKNTHDLAYFECSPDFLESGKEKLERGIQQYKYFFQENNDVEQHMEKGML